MNLNGIRSLYRDYNKIVSFFDDFREKIKDVSCDKNCAEFNADERFSCCRNHNVHFSSWIGYFGNSSCSTFREIVNSDLFWKSFDKYINSYKEEIFAYIANEFKEEISKNISVIEDEIKELNTVIKEVKKQ